MNVYQTLLCGFVLLGWIPLVLGTEPQFPTPRPYAGEASYEEMKKILPRVGGQWTVLSPENARTKFMLTWNGAVPRAWLQDGKEISVKDAPTYFGPMAYTIRSRLAEEIIKATIEPPRRNPPRDMKIKLRFRHPQGKPIQHVTVNGKQWPGYTSDTITIPSDENQRIEVVAGY